MTSNFPELSLEPGRDDHGPLRAALKAAERHLDGKVSRDAVERATKRAVFKRARAAKRWRALRLAASAAAGLAAVLLFVAWLRLDGPWAPSLDYEVVNGISSHSGYLRSESEATVRFSDGTVVTYARGSQGRVLTTDPSGAHLTLESGQARVSVVKRPGARWRVDAGPYVVSVTGTEFDLTWNAEAAGLDLRLYSGSVTVVGPRATNGISLKAGERLQVDRRSERVSIEALLQPLRPSAPDPSVSNQAGSSGTQQGASPVSSAKAAAESPAAPTQVGDGRALPVVASSPSWSSLLASGAFGAVLNEAHAEGVESALKTRSRRDLAAMADAARYERDVRLARRALLALRSRFPTSVESQQAGFLLGRLAESSGEHAVAMQWYETYLREAGGGAFADEAMGRKLLLVAGGGDNPRTQALAKEYLAHHPAGTYGTAARKILNR